MFELRGMTQFAVACSVMHRNVAKPKGLALDARVLYKRRKLPIVDL